MRRLLFSFGIALLSASAPQLARADPPHLSATGLTESSAIVIDGTLDEPEWSAAAVGEDFVERTPHPGDAPPVRTTLRVLFDADALYIAVESFLVPGEPPRALVMTRDSTSIWNDDAISVKIDARRDLRTTLGFVVSASGAQLDYLALDNGRVLRREYDMLWESAVRITEDRWIVEVRIPAVSLGLSDAEGTRSIGLNISRDHAGRAATYDWSPVEPEFGAFSALHYGLIDDLAVGAHGAPIATTIYSLGEYRSRGDDGSEHAFRGLAGLDSLMRVGGDTWAEITALTDFSQVDLDDSLVNLDRFPLFYPERRAFFLNGLDVLDFGIPGVLQPFYSRRIGLDDRGRSVPVLGGLKIYGREGALSFGILDVQTDETASTAAVQNFATRARISLGGPSYVGVLALTRVPFHWDGAPVTDDAAHGTTGLDLLLRFGEGDRFQLYAFGAATAREAIVGSEGASGGPSGGPSGGAAEPASTGGAAGLTFGYLGENLQPRLTASWVNDTFDAQLGFVRRTGAAPLRVDAPFLVRPGGVMRRLQLNLNGEVQSEDALDRLLYVAGELDLSAELEGGWLVVAGADYIEDVVSTDFELQAGHTVRAGTYAGSRLEVGLYSPGPSNPRFAVYYYVRNGYFGGELHNPSAELDIAFGPFVTLELSANVAYTTLPEQDPFFNYAVNGLLRVTPSTNVQLDLIARLDGRNERAIAMARLRWRYLPGSDLYVVWREDLDFQLGQVVLERTITIKTTFRFDFLA